ncbi:hypothetical protein SPRG_10861 [Saprolegnia parasitica CBS 223.65]|uniref:START domain-containing protein n=1 Tax=Saprolegnia parasitica (strain CBS 223.65) TaxID=695850 RepID=A0A067BZW9_SAPPC|nr:hypothetical protein SPRG_10861 [Saprolegnia parasitica CBS 223.65]KDO24074.1 hypothetical protein SPRG_10861 [Saprolegnia parasitica CBS 223.65]|eukprot:XP_012205210.1 hypothetical protein SPRG_10861 [Saprolegnia parasitica CBS 223.65]
MARKPKVRRIVHLQRLREQVRALEVELRRIKRAHIMILSWEDVAGAMANDTLAQVRTNRSLKKECAYHARLARFLHEWMLTMAPPQPLSPQSSWRDACLIQGDASARQAAYEWVLQQLWCSTDSAMARVSERLAYVNSTFDVAIDVNLDDGPLSIQVVTQSLLPCSLADVARAFWHADLTFVAHALSRDFTQLDQGQERNIVYLHDSIGPEDDTIGDNTLYGRFDEPGRSVIVMRSITSDAAYPNTGDVWSVDTKQWMVAEAVDAWTTRCRVFFQMGHPRTSSGDDVPLCDVGRLFGCDGNDDDDGLFQHSLRECFRRRHYDQRLQFAAYLDHVLHNLPSPSVVGAEELSTRG